MAIGEGATTTLSDSIALGNGAVADRAKYDESNNKYTAYFGDETGETKKDSAWRSTANAIAIGSDDSSNPVTRQIIGVAAGTKDTDAVNVAQLKAATVNTAGITRKNGTSGSRTTIEGGFSVYKDNGELMPTVTTPRRSVSPPLPTA